jgi:hypothetical protein
VNDAEPVDLTALAEVRCAFAIPPAMSALAEAALRKVRRCIILR